MRPKTCAKWKVEPKVDCAQQHGGIGANLHRIHDMDLVGPIRRRLPAQRANGGFLRFAVAVMFLVPSYPTWSQNSEKLAGSFSVIDGDTLEIEGQIVQLHGIDAPELGQTCLIQNKRWRCGLEAAFALKRLVATGPVVCSPTSQGDAPDHAATKAVCVAGSADLAEKLLQKGYAVALEPNSPSYTRAEASAKTARLGLWRSAFISPWDWRQGIRLPGGPADEIVVCEIKGTINRQNQRVFYLPSDKGYGAITLDESKGERMFCSDDAALLAGWKRIPRR